MSNNFTLITQELDFILVEQRTLDVCGPHIRIWHRGRKPWAQCWPGEEAASAALALSGHEFHISLSPTGLLIFDYIATHRYLPQSATEIAQGLRSEPFYREHGTNVGRGPAKQITVSRAVVKTYINRIRRALASVFAEAGLELDPYSILISETTDTNVVKYRLHATVEVVHSE
jgi:hypothetical protein